MGQNNHLRYSAIQKANCKRERLGDVSGAKSHAIYSQKPGIEPIAPPAHSKLVLESGESVTQAQCR
jgi:hypothetical protein